MKTDDVINCSFTSWYYTFASVTTESFVIPLPESFITYLHTDGLVLPDSSSTHGLYAKSKNTAMDGDEDDPDIRDDDLMKMYEDDWSTPSDAKTAKSPDFGEFDQHVKEAIKSLGGRVFPKLNWSSPKDASWISFDKTLMCACPSDVYLLLKSSEFIAHDLDQPFLHCEDSGEMAGATKHPSVTYSLILRRWEPPDPSTEFRCFVYKKRILGICQRNSTKFFSHIVAEKSEIMEDITSFFDSKVAAKFPSSSFVFDVVRLKKGKVKLLDFNPYGPVTDALLFTWDELKDLAMKADKDSSLEPCFRCVESEEGVQSSDYGNYAFPQDIQDLTAGEDPYKFMDLMKLKIQKDGEDDSSTDDEDDQQNDGKDKTGNSKQDLNKTEKEELR